MPRAPRITRGHHWWVIAAFAVLGLSAMLPVIQKSTATSRGYTLQHQQSERSELLSELRVLEAEVARLMSQERIERRAAQLGLIPAEQALYVEVSEPGPEPAKIPAEYLAARPRVTTQAAPWWESLLSRLPLVR